VLKEKTMSKKKSLPKFIAVRWEDGGNDEYWLQVFENAEHACEPGETHEIGIYELREKKRGSLEPKFS
jgi:hypothetical protein